MLVQLNRQNDDNVPITATDLPLNASATLSLTPAVAVVGPAGRIAGLRDHLRPGWTLRHVHDLDDVRPGELVLLTTGGDDAVRAARDLLPRRTRIVAVVDETAPAALVAAVLTAGADVCVRGGQPAILAGHLAACHRRQLADRWAALSAAAAHQ
ncbi:hypothetical protein [Mangrovihabitans endophyticus]|uniref:Uncharacterized protein n=1 Tax=Mangrovihabitans endophyticus TaxID=1751298 RepID=A0A8J3C7N5_9ACTN|nr:hypothetical protein [Mangrovihabitans endophyticus]GGL16684.1 hypothetical protein GCM10012284_59100 [Mangrovihabitans endophyticus]